MKSSCPRRPSRVVAGPWLFNPSARNSLPERLPGWEIWWLGSHPAQQSFGQHPSWPNDFHSCLAFPGRPALPVQQTAAWAGMPTTQEHSGLKCFGMEPPVPATILPRRPHGQHWEPESPRASVISVRVPPLTTHHRHRGLEPGTVHRGGEAQNHRFCTIPSEIYLKFRRITIVIYGA